MTANTDRPARYRWLRILLAYLAALLGFVVIIFAVVAALSGPATSEHATTIATSEVDGRSVAVVVYEADTIGHFDIFRLEAMGFSTQAEAFDLDTGDRIWDTMLMTEFGGTEADVLAMGAEYVYVRSEDGLVILDAGTGEIVAREAEIAGLGDDYIASIGAYVWDAAAQAVVLLDANGGVRSIPVDSLEAGPAGASLSERWRDTLNVDDDAGSVFHPRSWEPVDSWAPVPGGEQIDPTWAASGWEVDALVDATTGFAAGSPYGFAVTQTYQPETHDGSYLVQVGELASQRLLESVAIETGVAAVVDDGRGHVVMLAGGDDRRARLVIATADGIRSSIIGERGFFGQ